MFQFIFRKLYCEITTVIFVVYKFFGAVEIIMYQSVSK